MADAAVGGSGDDEKTPLHEALGYLGLEVTENSHTYNVPKLAGAALEEDLEKAKAEGASAKALEVLRAVRETGQLVSLVLAPPEREYTAFRVDGKVGLRCGLDGLDLPAEIIGTKKLEVLCYNSDSQIHCGPLILERLLVHFPEIPEIQTLREALEEGKQAYVLGISWLAPTKPGEVTGLYTFAIEYGDEGRESFTAAAGAFGLSPDAVAEHLEKQEAKPRPFIHYAMCMDSVEVDAPPHKYGITTVGIDWRNAK